MVTDAVPEDITPVETPSLETTSEGLTSRGIRSIQGETQSTSDWVERGIVDVPVAALPEPEGVAGPQDFDHHLTWEDARQTTEQIPQLQQEVNAGKTGDDYSAEDAAAGLDYADGRRRLYDLYYGGNAITVCKDGDQYDIIDGRHRVYAAKALGLETIPARLTEKVATS